LNAPLQNIQLKLLFSIVSLLLLAIVIYAPPSFQKVNAASDTTMVAAGDWGCSDNTEKTVQNVMNLNPKLLLALGDFSYDKSSTCWLNVMKPLESITKISIGNHEVESDKLLNTYLVHFGLSKQYYSFNVNNVHVLTMATEEEYKPNSDQYYFVEDDLRKAANNPDIKWIVVTMHNPFYSSPNGCEASDCEGDEDYRKSFHPLFDKYGVDLVLQGHVHNYQRSLPLAFNQEDSSMPLVKSTSKNDYKNPNGVVFAIVGTGGVNLHGLSDKAPYMAYQQDSKFGILHLQFSDSNIDAKFVSNDGATLDHFSIAKTAKKAVIERISDDTASDTNVKAVSDKKTTKAQPLADQAQVQEDKPAITFKLDEDEDAPTDTKAKPLADQAEIQEDKPAVTFKLDEDEDAPTDTKAKPLADQAEVQEDKPAMTTKLGDDPPTDDSKPMLLSDEQVEQEQDKPPMTAKLGDDPPTDDKPMSLSEEKVDLSDKEKSASFQSAENVDKSPVQDLLESSENNGPIDDEVSDSDKVKSIDTNQRDPFAALN
jgi:Calcineurin-like phosphoesterase